MIEILFLFGFLLHNLEEGLWLPAWSAHAGRFHHPVQPGEFRFALIVVTTLGYLITAAHLLAAPGAWASYIYHGFVGMMVANVLMPHVVATIALRRYAPGLLTGLFLNLPLGGFVLFRGLQGGLDPLWILAATACVAVFTIGLITLSFRMGRRWLRGLE